MFKIHSTSVSALWGSQGHILRTLYIPCLGRQSVTEHIHIYGNLGWPVHLLACVVLFFFIQVRGNKGTKWKQWEHAKLLTGNNTTSEPKLGPWSCLVSTLPAYATSFFFLCLSMWKSSKWLPFGIKHNACHLFANSAHAGQRWHSAAPVPRGARQLF